MLVTHLARQSRTLIEWAQWKREGIAGVPGPMSLTHKCDETKNPGMLGASAEITRWLLFCRSRGISHLREEIACVCGSRRIEASFSIRPERSYNASAEGELLGATLSFEAKSRRRLPGDEENSRVPLFVGTFNYAEGVSGDFVVRPKSDGELMALGVYGAPPAFHLIRTDPSRTASPVEILGVPGWKIHLEDPAQYEPSISKKELPAAGNPLHFAGYCVGRAERNGNLPMPGVLVTMLLAYQLLLKPYHLKSAD